MNIVIINIVQQSITAIFQPIKMKKLLGFDQNYQQLRQLKMICSAFEGFSLYNVREYSRTVIQDQDNSTKLQGILKILDQQNTNSYRSLKSLMIVNFFIHDSVKKQKKEFEEILSDFINNLTIKQRIRFQQQQQKRINPRRSSIEKATDWFKQRISRSKQKPTLSHIRTLSHNSNGTIQCQPSKPAPLPSGSSLQPSACPSGKQQLLISKIVIPYSSYLLKLISSELNLSSIPSQLKMQQIWKFINLIKYLLKLGESFPTFCRYYENDYHGVVYGMIRVIDFELKVLYPLVEKEFEKRFEIVKEGVIAVYAKADGRKRGEMLEELVGRLEVNQLKEIIDQISTINQSIIAIYLGKYTFQGVKAMGLRQPFLCQTSNNKCDIIFDILKQIQKTKLTKRQSSSKQKHEFSTHSYTTPNKAKKQIAFPKNHKPPQLQATKLRLKLTSDKDGNAKQCDQYQVHSYKVKVRSKTEIGDEVSVGETSTVDLDVDGQYHRETDKQKQKQKQGQAQSATFSKYQTSAGSVFKRVRQNATGREGRLNDLTNGAMRRG